MAISVAIARNGVIENIAEAETLDFLIEQFPDAEVFAASGVGIGWVFDGSEWVAPTPPAPPAPVTPALTRRQLRLALLSIGVTDADVEAHIATIEDPMERASALIEWQDASSYERTHPLVAEVAESMDLPASQVDDLWLWASAL